MASVDSSLARGKSISGIRALAEQLSLSAGTISNVFNRPDVVAEPTRKRVLDAAQGLGYVPDRHASVLRSKRSKLIGVLVSSMDNPFYVQQTQEIQDAAAEQGYEIVLASSGHWDVQREIQAVRYLSSLRVEGVVMVVRASSRSAEHIWALIDGGCQVVMRGEVVDGIDGASLLNVDIEQGAKQAAEYLIALGHKHLAVMVQGQHGQPVDLAREPKLHGVYQAMEQAGLDKNSVETIVYHRESLLKTSDEIARRFNQKDRYPTAILANNDAYALAIVAGLEKAGLSVPRDVSVVGFDNIEASELYHPPLTTVSQTHLNLGQRAVELLLDKIENPDRTPEQLKLAPKLIVRQSTAPPKNGSAGVPPVEHISGQDNFNNEYQTTKQTSNQSGEITAPKKEVNQQAAVVCASI